MPYLGIDPVGAGDAAAARFSIPPPDLRLGAFLLAALATEAAPAAAMAADGFMVPRFLRGMLGEVRFTSAVAGPADGMGTALLGGL